MKQLINLLVGTGFCLALSACGAGQGADILNPYADSSTASLGVANNRRAQAPQPGYPVVQPAEVRLMWIPDHLNKYGDLVPQHFYYLKVLDDRWAVQDAFDIERQLNEGDEGQGGATPWVYRERR